jgi:putative glutamine amidotransferase
MFFSNQPFIAIPADRRMLGLHPFHAVGEKYIVAIVQQAHAVPLLVPALPELLDIEAILAHVAGVFFTGSPSNVEPQHYGGLASEPGTLHDPSRDGITLPLIRAAIDRGMPVLGVCRGFQEINVALGGTLHQKLHEVPGFSNHHEDLTQPLEIQYGLAHEVELTPGGLFQNYAQGASRMQVNSLHTQGIAQLAPGLEVEARALDGVIEGVRVANAPGFAVAVQWHPEWQAGSNAFSRTLFSEFGTASRNYARQHLRK